jgi:hypothetical protein
LDTGSGLMMYVSVFCVLRFHSGVAIREDARSPTHATQSTFHSLQKALVRRLAGVRGAARPKQPVHAEQVLHRLHARRANLRLQRARVQRAAGGYGRRHHLRAAARAAVRPFFCEGRWGAWGARGLKMGAGGLSSLRCVSCNMLYSTILTTRTRPHFHAPPPHTPQAVLVQPGP